MKKTDQVELGRSFQQQEKVKVKVHKNKFVPFWDGTMRRRSLAEHNFPEGI